MSVRDDGNVNFGFGSLSSGVANGASAVAFTLNDPSYSTSTSKLFQIKNQGDAVFEVNHAGTTKILNWDSNKYATIDPYQGLDIFYSDTNSDVSIGSSSSRSLRIVSSASNQLSLEPLTTPTGGGFVVRPQPMINDLNLGSPMYVSGGNAYQSAVSNLVGGTLYLTGGAGASGSAGLANGGDVKIDGGTLS